MQKGDIVHIEYELWIKGAKNELFETNIEGVAKAQDKWSPEAKYGPTPVIIGFDRNMKKIEDSMQSAGLGTDYEVEIPPADGAGERDPEKVKLYLMREILKLPEFQKKDAKYPELGMDIFIDGKVGHIAGIYAGRVRVDFNPRLAGKTINYKYKIVKKDEAISDKVKSLVEMEYGSSTEFGITAEGEDSVTIVLPDVCKYDNNWFKAKYIVVADLRDILNIKVIKFIEEYRKKEEKHEDHDHTKEEEVKKDKNDAKKE